MKNSIKRRIEREVKEDVKRRFKGFFTSPATYIGAALQAYPMIVMHTMGAELVRQQPLPTKAVYFGNIVIGQSIFFYSIFRNFGTPAEYKNALVVQYRAKKQWKRQWKWFNDVMYELRSFGLPELEHIIKGAERVLAEREDFNKALNLVEQGAAILKKLSYLDGGSAKLQLQRTPERGTGLDTDEMYGIVTKKAYDRLSNNQRLRVQYFIDDIACMVEPVQRLELYRSIRRSRWYDRRMTDMRTYTFFDDITLGLRRGSIPSEQLIVKYVDGL